MVNQPNDNSRSNNWCFTLNNYNDEDVTRIRALQTDSNIVVFGYEVGESGTPHLQGFIQFKSRYRFSRVKVLVGQTAHLEIARHPTEAAEYCRKDGNFEEFGTLVVQGQRSDIKAFQEIVKGGELNMKRLREQCPEVCAKYARFVNEYIMDQIEAPVIETHPLRNWQQYLNLKLNRPADPREIVFVVDKDGNAGKSWFCRYYENNHSETTQCLIPARKIDMAYLLRCTNKVVFIDAPRSKQSEFIFYDFLEEIKNGYVMSSKYEPCIKKFKSPHVVVFMNEDPDMAKLSADRYCIIDTSREYRLTDGLDTRG